MCSRGLLYFRPCFNFFSSCGFLKSRTCSTSQSVLILNMFGWSWSPFLFFYLMYFNWEGQSESNVIEQRTGHHRWEGERAYDGGHQHGSVSSQKAPGKTREASWADGWRHPLLQFVCLGFASLPINFSSWALIGRVWSMIIISCIT